MFDFVKPDRIGLSSVPPQKSRPTTVVSQSKKPKRKTAAKNMSALCDVFISVYLSQL
jgi:hypothetical protein